MKNKIYFFIAFLIDVQKRVYKGEQTKQQHKIHVEDISGQ